MCAAPTCAERTMIPSRRRERRECGRAEGRDPVGGVIDDSLPRRSVVEVNTEMFAAGAVRLVPSVRDADESGVLAAGRGDVHVVIGLAPDERTIEKRIGEDGEAFEETAGCRGEEEGSTGRSVPVRQPGADRR